MTSFEAIEYTDLYPQGYEEVFPALPPGIEHYCIACSPENPLGLKMRFFGNIEKREVVSRQILSKIYCGFPNYTHGGIITLMMDEVMSHTLFYLFGQYGVTKNLNIDFLRPVLIDTPMFIRAVIDDDYISKNPGEYRLESFIHEGTNASGKICAKSQGVLIILPDEKLKRLYQ